MSGFLRRKLLIVGVVLGVGCIGGDVPSSLEPNRSAGTLTALVNDASYTAQPDRVTTTTTATDLTIAAIDDIGRRLELHLFFAPPQGVVALGNGHLSYVTYQTDARIWTSELASATGSVVMTSRTSTSATGTFAVTLMPLPASGATGPVTVSNGTFSVQF